MKPIRKRKAVRARSRASLGAPGAPFGDRGLSHHRALAFAQAREQHDLPVREFKRIVMDHSVLHVDLPEAREPLSDFLVGEDAELALDILVERNLRARQQTDCNMRLPNRGKPRVIELLNLVVTSLSSIWAGRVATLCKLEALALQV